MTCPGDAAADPETIIRLLGLEPLPDEGGLFRRMYLDDASSAIYYLLADGDFSALHRLSGPEVYHHYLGAPLGLLVLHPDGRIEESVLGVDLAAGQRPQLVVPGGTWHGSWSLGEFSLIGTTMAPPFDWESFVLGDRAALTAAYPAAADRIAALTRSSSPGLEGC